MLSKTIIETATLYLGDCLDVLPDLDEAVNCVVMDPPYCSGGFTEAARKRARGMGLRSETRKSIGWFDGDNMTSAGLAWMLRQVSSLASEHLMPGGTLSAFTDWRMVPHLAPAIESTRQNLIVWNKGRFGLGTGFRAQHELLMHFAKGVPNYHDASIGNVITTPRPPIAGRHHQTEKPVELLKQIIRVSTPPGGIVIDPFMGSGTTGVACAHLGRRFIGMEIDPVHFAVACRRIEAAHRQKNMFSSDVPAPLTTQGILSDGGAA